MLNTLTEFPVRNGAVLETYSVEQDEAGDIFIRNVLDADMGGPVDTMHIDRAAAVRIAAALLLAVGMGERVVASTKAIPIRSMQDMITVGRWPA